ncbi:hypothetical protein EK21DRAFT_112188 [Setomelanomma holmii]|uniref:Uncharacterized protein n=1 Tax=Setomelanomma holmii TaxID=210430 RepID=A0A9P4LMI5_9PLEO|nr:hypothetical protein EK21DRAFT_112188 [Setomelanomma holmii]
MLLVLSHLFETWFFRDDIHSRRRLSIITTVLKAVAKIDLAFKNLEPDLFISTRPQRGCSALACENILLVSLPVILAEVSSFQCADARDMIYGVLFFVEWPTNYKLIPNYEKGVVEIATEVLNVYKDDNTDPGFVYSIVRSLALKLSPTESTQVRIEARKIYNGQAA